MGVPAGWLKKASIEANKPQQLQNTIIGKLKQNLGGPRPGRSREVLHASDITQPDFCPRHWAFLDMQGVKSEQQFLSATQAATFSMGSMTARTLIEEWAGDSVVGNWRCKRCGAQATMTKKPATICSLAWGADKSHLWEYIEVVIPDPEYGVVGSLDAIFDVGTAKLMVTELKIMAPEEFAEIKAPLAEHRLRTALYLKLIADSSFAYKDKLNLLEARVLYVSRGYGKKNDAWGQILPFREFEVSRDDEAIKPNLQRAKALKIFRQETKMPSGICDTAFDKYAKKCDSCKDCFSGKYPAVIDIKDM